MINTSKVKELAAEYEEKSKFGNSYFRIIELYTWLIISLACLSRVFFEWLNGASLADVLRFNFADLLLGFFVIIFPVIYQLVFGELPLETLRRRKINQNNSNTIVQIHSTTYKNVAQKSKSSMGSDFDANQNKNSINRQSLSASREELAKSMSSEFLLLELAESSKKLADGIYGRSGVYLLVGVMVAFSGLAFFYTQTSGTFDTKDITALMVSLAPKFGILFFIEFVAFFFLKQYRTSMDEYRYYEAIKRRREEMLVLVKIGIEQNKPVDSFELVKLGQFFSMAGRLDKEETTELLEARKLEKNETAVLEKAIDAIAQARK